MTRSRPKKAPPASAGQSAPAAAPRWLVAGGLAGLLIAVVLLQWDLGPSPPKISVDGLDPIVAAQITQAVARVSAERISAEAWGNLAITLQVHDLVSEADTCYRWASRLAPR